VRAYGTGLPLVIDTSAWARQQEPAVLPRWQATIEAGLLVTCPVSTLEILTSTRDEQEYALVSGDLLRLRQAPVTTSACAAALQAARELRGSRRLPAADYLIAAAAAERGFAVLHEDAHFDTLAQVLGFESVRLSDAD
jgi:predicted nucleic acid-binding protein